jgi:hypothetical protein
LERSGDQSREGAVYQGKMIERWGVFIYRISSGALAGADACHSGLITICGGTELVLVSMQGLIA